jgi:hypothetical protein
VPGVKSSPAEFHVASTWANAIVGFASVAFAVAEPWRKPTVMMVWQPSSISDWMLRS